MTALPVFAPGVAWFSGSAVVDGLDLGHLDGQLRGEGAAGQGPSPALPQRPPTTARPGCAADPKTSAERFRAFPCQNRQRIRHAAAPVPDPEHPEFITAPNRPL